MRPRFVPETIRKALTELDEALFPSNIYCISCGSLIDRTRLYSLCDECVKRFHWNTGRTCLKCGKAIPDTSRGRLCYDCMQQEHAFARGFSALTYGLYERKIMMDLKYAGKGYIALKCGDMMFDRMEEEIKHGLFSSGGEEPGIIVPVPVSEGRKRVRGYNQAELMARQFAARWRAFAGPGEKIPECCPEMLFRARETKMLRGLNPAERVLELKGAFQVRGGCRKKLEGKNVLLIDDIYTTGATADACSLALIGNGAEKVYVLTLASGGNRRPKEADSR